MGLCSDPIQAGEKSNSSPTIVPLQLVFMGIMPLNLEVVQSWLVAIHRHILPDLNPILKPPKLMAIWPSPQLVMVNSTASLFAMEEPPPSATFRTQRSVLNFHTGGSISLNTSCWWVRGQMAGKFYCLHSDHVSRGFTNGRSRIL